MAVCGAANVAVPACAEWINVNKQITVTVQNQTQLVTVANYDFMFLYNVGHSDGKYRADPLAILNTILQFCLGGGRAVGLKLWESNPLSAQSTEVVPPALMSSSWTQQLKKREGVTLSSNARKLSQRPTK